MITLKQGNYDNQLLCNQSLIEIFRWRDIIWSWELYSAVQGWSICISNSLIHYTPLQSATKKSNIQDFPSAAHTAWGDLSCKE